MTLHRLASGSTGVAAGMELADLAVMVETVIPELWSMFLNAMPQPAVVTAEDLAAVVAWLASDDARYVTGAQIPVDLGTRPAETGRLVGRDRTPRTPAPSFTDD